MSTRTWCTIAVASVLVLGACGKTETPAPATTAPAASSGGASGAISSATSAAAAAMSSADAKKLIDQATQYIKDHKLDLAEQAVTELEKAKSSLPADMQPQVDNLRKLLDAAKAMPATSMPAMPKL